VVSARRQKSDFVKVSTGQLAQKVRDGQVARFHRATSPSRKVRARVKDRLDRIAELIDAPLHRQPHRYEDRELSELHAMIFEELRMLRERTDSWERFIGSLRKGFQ
jgi:hypothetical protein